MIIKESSKVVRLRRHERVRKVVKGTTARPRLSVFRSSGHVYAQVIDDTAGTTIAAASTLDPDLKDSLSGKKKSEKAGLVGALVAKRALDKAVTEVVFDRGGFRYQGRVKALADAARSAGLRF